MGPSFLLRGPQEEALLEGILLGTWSGKLALRAVELSADIKSTQAPQFLGPGM